MSKFKVGDEVVLLEPSEIELKKGLKKGQVFKVCEILGDDMVIVNSIHGLYFSQIDFNKYYYSNRNKLREHIKSLGFTAIDLSVAAGFNKYYFGSETGEARFNKRGDISDKRFYDLEALASSAFAKLHNKSIGKLTVDLEVKTTFVSDQSKELIEKLPENKPEKIKSKWIVSNKVFFTFVFIVSLLILFIATGVVKQVF